MADASNPCPYQPFGLPCSGTYGHGSPHALLIEQPVVDNIIRDIEERAVAGYIKKLPSNYDGRDSDG
jgi:hypothetical protein